MKEKKFNEIYEKTYHKVVSYVISKCDNLSNVEEIVEEVYIKLYKQLIKDSLYVKDYNSFLIKLAKNELFKYYSLKNKFKVILNINTDENINLIDNIEDKSINIEDEIINKYNLETLWKVIKKQTLITQKIITLYYLENMKIKDISNLLKMKESTVKSILYRGINKIKEEIKIGDVNE